MIRAAVHAAHAMASLAVLAALLAWPGPAAANDGFFQGAGSHLVPVKSVDLRVRRETLVIAPLEPPSCADVLFRGKPIRFPADRFASPSLPVTAEAAALSLGAPRPCGPSIRVRHRLVARWRADAVYEVTALAPARDVLIGFPVPTWGFDFLSPEALESFELPAVARFETFVDGARVKGLETRKLERVTEGPEGPAGALGYTWRASFPAGARRTLRTVYDFGEEVSSGFYLGHEYLGAPPWFLPGWPGRPPGASTLRYYLTPIRTWAEPPPDELVIRLDLPQAVPVTAFVPVGLRPACVDEHALHFRLERRFPDQDLVLAYPDEPGRLPRFQTPAHWAAWRASLGGDPVRLTCKLKDRLAAGGDPALRKVLAKVACVRRCEDRGR